MKKVLFLALPLVLFTGVASAVNQCNPGGVSTNYTFAQLSAQGFSCEVGDKIFSNFTGSFQTTTDTMGFTNTPNNLQESLNLNAGSEFFLSGTFTFNYVVTVDPTVLFPGFTASIASMSGSVQDANVNSRSTLNKVTTPNVGPQCTVTVNDLGGGNANANVCNYGGTPTSMTVTESFTYTGPGGGSGVTGFSNTITENLTPTGGTPEPVSMILFGSGLLAISLLGRKKLSRR